MAVVIWWWERVVHTTISPDSVLLLVGAGRVGGAHAVAWPPKPLNVLQLFTGKEAASSLEEAAKSAMNDIVPEGLTADMLPAILEGLANGVPLWCELENDSCRRRREAETAARERHSKLLAERTEAREVEEKRRQERPKKAKPKPRAAKEEEAEVPAPMPPDVATSAPKPPRKQAPPKGTKPPPPAPRTKHSPRGPPPSPSAPPARPEGHHGGKRVPEGFGRRRREDTPEEEEEEEDVRESLSEGSEEFEETAGSIARRRAAALQADPEFVEQSVNAPRHGMAADDDEEDVLDPSQLTTRTTGSTRSRGRLASEAADTRLAGGAEGVQQRVREVGGRSTKKKAKH